MEEGSAIRTVKQTEINPFQFIPEVWLDETKFAPIFAVSSDNKDTNRVLNRGKIRTGVGESGVIVK